MRLHEQENSSQVKQKIYHELIQKNDYHTKIRKQIQ